MYIGQGNGSENKFGEETRGQSKTRFGPLAAIS